MSKPIECVEIITGIHRRRRYTAEEKVRLVEQTMQPGMTVSAVARLSGGLAQPAVPVRAAHGRGRAEGGQGRRGGRADQPRAGDRESCPRARAPARPQDHGDRDPARGPRAGPPRKTRLALAVATTGRFLAKAVADTIGVARSNLVDQLRRSTAMEMVRAGRHRLLLPPPGTRHGRTIASRHSE